MSKNPLHSLASRITAARIRHQQTRRAQAEKIGVCPRTLARWVAGSHHPDPTSPTGVALITYLKRMGV